MLTMLFLLCFLHACFPCLMPTHQMEFDPALELDVVHAPHGWQAPDLFTAPGEFLEGMRPMLDHYLAAQGQQPTHDLEWQVGHVSMLRHISRAQIESAEWL
jgi:hypothetical protein